ncbi:hypothetical protein HT136_13130 [Novosphingobium profundi]|uniref:hypothetical protein n=1 Tax=Novosphingobium profundi TaxID=1774954 RepID=UPI001BDB16B2|nr:hypothetical protein [Novosphingobium profundi]MBT0669308.1 hypothetical protein [Novosphingobium profundi]
MKTPCLPIAFAALALSVSLPAIAAEPAVASEPEVTALDARIAAELHRLDLGLDPQSRTLLRDNQDMWSAWTREAMAKAQTMVADGEGTDADRAELAQALRAQRLSFLHALKTEGPEGLSGGWGNGLTEVLVDRENDPRAKLVSITNVMGARDAVCALEGAVREDATGITITPASDPRHPVHLHRQGIALVIEGAVVPKDDATRGCRFDGAYFPIEGADKIMPWLVN